MSTANTVITVNTTRPETHPFYYNVIPDGYDVKKCGEIEYCQYSVAPPTLEMTFNQFKEDLQKIITKIVERIEVIESRIGDIEERIRE